MAYVDDQLLENGLITIFGPIHDELAEQVYKQFVLLAAREDLQEIGIVINSTGGSLSSSLVIANLIETSSTPVKTVCAHTAMSGGLLILMSGHYRMATHNAILMSHRFMAGKYGDHEDLVAFRDAEDHYHDMLVKHYITHSKLKNKTEVEKFLLKESDKYLKPNEALKYGLIDKVLKKAKITVVEKGKK